MAKKLATANGPVISAGNVKFQGRSNSARALYYDRMANFVGKPLSDFVADCAANPPSVPAKGKHVGTPEPIKGWVSWLTRNGYFSITQ